MKEPDHNAVTAVKILYHSKREQISYATLFSELVHSETAVSKLQLLASCSSQFKVLVFWQCCAGGKSWWGWAPGHSKLHKAHTRSCFSNSLMTATPIPTASFCSVIEIHALPMYRVCLPLLLCGDSSSSPQTPPLNSLPTNWPPV